MYIFILIIFTLIILAGFAIANRRQKKNGCDVCHKPGCNFFNHKD